MTGRGKSRRTSLDKKCSSSNFVERESVRLPKRPYIFTSSSGSVKAAPSRIPIAQLQLRKNLLGYRPPVNFVSVSAR